MIGELLLTFYGLYCIIICGFFCQRCEYCNDWHLNIFCYRKNYDEMEIELV